MEIKEFNKASLIGISGGLLVGKDLVGKIIQYLTLNKKNVSSLWIDRFSIEKYIIEDINISSISDWNIKKFADKLKSIVCLLLNCTIDDIENREFKEKILGEEWWYYKHKNNKNIFAYDSNNINNINIKDYDLIKLTPRMLLQIIGTDLFRKQLNPKVWVNATFSEYIPKESKWLITDCRFPDELEEIKKRNGITIKIKRDLSLRFPEEWEAYLNSSFNTIYIDTNRTDSYIEEGTIEYPYKTIHTASISQSDMVKLEKGFIKYIQNNTLYNNLYKKLTHESEMALDNYDDNKYDYIIDNNGDIITLINNVKEILIKEKLI
jgi:hypothetical protein